MHSQSTCAKRAWAASAKSSTRKILTRRAAASRRRGALPKCCARGCARARCGTLQCLRRFNATVAIVHGEFSEECVMAARSTSTSGRSSDAPRDAIALLKQDHRTVSALFEEFEKAEEEEQSAIAQRVCQLLTVHATIEEELLYPA